MNMKRRIIIFITLLLLILFVPDIYIFYGLKKYLDFHSSFQVVVYWGIPLFFSLYLLYVLKNRTWLRTNSKDQKILYGFMGGFILFYLPKILLLIFLFFNDLLQFMLQKWIPGLHIGNIVFLTGLLISSLLFMSILYGILIGKFHFTFEKIFIKSPKITQEWEGLRIVHISDLHLGSWGGANRQLQKAVEMINSQNPDLIFFTGDLVNNSADELEGFLPILRELEARIGKYSVLGNHDYGDYYPWDTQQEKELNLQKIKAAHGKMGFHLLLNDAAVLEGKTSKLGIIGVENWGLPPFHQYGDLKQALSSRKEQTDFTVLLSHDPSHWRAEVIKYPTIDLMLSGHTHGMQFGFYNHRFKWSPSKWKYPEWGGLYSENGQHLYVNTGLGFIGFPGRVGIRPRITLIELEKA